jgi:glutathione S-transferase
MTIRLYTFESFNPKKVELALYELGLPFEPITVDLYQRQNKTESFLALNPRGKVPVIEADGFVLTESHAILAWLGEREGRLWPTDPAGRATALSWLFYATGHLEEDIGTAWFHAWTLPRLGRPGDAGKIEAACLALRGPLKHLERAVTDAPYVLGTFSLVDVSIAVLIEALLAAPFDLDAFPAITAWHERVRARPTWERLGLRYRRSG